MSRAQSVTDADHDIQRYLVGIAGNLGDLLGDTLVGVYVHGSLAMGSYHRERSDIDILAVVDGRLHPEMREAVAQLFVRISDMRPTPGDIEATVVQDRYARSYEHPMPFEVHYSSGQRKRITAGESDYTQNPTDLDLAAHITNARERGVRIFGPEPRSVFGPVPWFAYINALEADFNWAGERAKSDPLYAILNACRTLYGATQRDLRVLSKDEAARWALESIPREFEPLVREALDVYRGASRATEFDAKRVAALREYVHERALPAFDRASDTGDDEEDA
ncbi:MAG: aminoglycoside adenylyltransferase domain-containing protein [Vulcanimicrobiaceae bacterium]